MQARKLGTVAHHRIRDEQLQVPQRAAPGQRE
jgi:hypothetical protein